MSETFQVPISIDATEPRLEEELADADGAMTAACIDDQEIHAAQNTSIGFGEGGEGKGAGCDCELAEGEAMVDGKALTFKYDSDGTESTNSSRDDITEKTIDGKIYLMEKDDSENLLYDTGTGECVGIYDEENDAVMPLEELDSDSDSD